MTNTVLIKRSSTANSVPAAGDLQAGELAINYADGNLFYKDTNDNVRLLASNKLVSVTGNITGANLNATGLSLSGNVVSNLNVSGAINATGNVTGNYFVGNGSQLTGIVASAGAAITNGTSNVTVAGNSNVTVGIATFTVATFASTGAYITGLTSVTGNIVTTANISSGYVLATGNVSGDYILGNGSQLTGIVSSYGNANVAANLAAFGSNPISTTGNITGGNLITIGTLSAGSLSLSGNVISTLNASLGIAAGTTISAAGNITGSYFIGNGSQLTGITSTYGNANVAANLAAFGTNPISTSGNITGGNLNAGGLSLSSNVVSDLNSTANITTTANISGGYILGNGSQLTGIVSSSYGNANVAANLAAFGTNPISTSGNITGGFILGNGSQLTGIVSSYGNANVAANLAAFGSNPISTTGNITGGNINTDTVIGTATTIRSTGALNLSATGNITVNSTYINGVLDPVQNQDVATKAYVDSVAQGLHVHDSANLASTADLATYTGATVTYNNGSSGVGATLSLVGNTLTTLDGTAIPASSSTRLLIKNQANAVQNGMYNYTSSSLLTRSTDFDTSAKAAGGDFLFVTSGATLADTGWVQTTDNPTLGTSPIVFAQFSGAGTYTANTSAGLVLNGTVFSAKTDNISTAFDGTGNIVVKASAQLTTPNIGAATGTSVSVTGNITGGNVLGGANVNATTHTGTTVSVTGNITGGNVLGGANVNATLFTGTTVSVTGNITGGNILGGANVNATTHTGATVSITGNVIAGGGIVTRVVSIADGTSVTINADTTDVATQTNTQVAGTLTINAPTGTLANGQKIMFRLQSSNVQTFSWNAVFAGSTDLSLPTASSGSSKYDYMGFMYNSTATKWQILAKNFGF